MSDLLTHVLVGYILGTAVSMKFDWITPPLVTIVMVGALLPDLAKLEIILPSSLITTMLGIPFSWFAIHTPFGAFVAAFIGTFLIINVGRLQTLSLLLIGIISHFMLDLLLISPSRLYHVLLWPYSTKKISFPSLYLSSDAWTAAIATVLAIVMYVLRWHVIDVARE